MLQMLVGAVIGVVVSILLDKPIRTLFLAIKKQTILFYRRHFRWKDEIPGTNSFYFGSSPTGIVVIDGNGKQPYKNGDISCILENEPPAVLPQVSVFRTAYEEEIRHKKANGEGVPWDGSLYSVHSFLIDRDSEEENMKLILRLHKTSYYTVTSVIHNLETRYVEDGVEKRLMDYIHSFHFESREKYLLPNGIGLCLSVITKDNYIIFAKRSASSEMRPGESDVSIVEGINPKLDGYNDLNFIDASKRAFKEEICDTDDMDLESNLSVNLLGFVFDKKYNQFNIIGVIETEMKYSEIVQERNRGALGKWELSNLDFVEFLPEKVITYIASHKMWDMALVTVYYALHFAGTSKKQINKLIDRMQH
jgi:hypothetical protein